ncbi:MAG TPA: hypothetical protein VGK99_18310 [Acidobacteriota bacterium]|jgi:hypothetical protein
MNGLLLFLAVLHLSGSEVSNPSFRDYTVRRIYRGKPATVDLRSHPAARRFRTRLRRGSVKGPNFAGHFIVVTWGCGSSCQVHAIIDAKTGRVFFPLSHPTSEGACFRLDSSLFVTDPINRETWQGWKGDLPDWLKTRYFRWTGSHMIEIISSRAMFELPCTLQW